jgi:quercetin dioxygenase-like cupin family protein
MNRLLGVSICLLLGTSAVEAQRAPDAVAVDPAHHNVLFENEHVRVFRALASPGERSPMHTHPPFVFIGLATARLRLATPTATNVIFDVAPGTVLWMENAEHSWEMLSGQAHIIAVEVKAATRGAPRPFTLPATDVVIVDPDAHQVALENEHVRVLSGHARAGQRSPMHTHSGDFVIVSFGRVRLRLTPQGASAPAIIDLYPGQVVWLERQAHSWEILAGEHNAFAVELKSTRR